MNALTRDLRTAAAAANSARPAAAGKSFRANVFDALHALARRWRARRETARPSGYPDQMLKDIGVSRGGIPWAVRHGRGERSTAPLDEIRGPSSRHVQKRAVENGGLLEKK